MLLINAENLIIGRLASFVAKKALEGEKIIIVNSEKALITGRKENIFEKYKQRADRGDAIKGPFFPRTPDRILRRAIRGMLPYKKEKGKIAFKKVMCYIGTPEKYKNIKQETVKQADIKKTKSRYINLERLSKYLKR
jgi:large subunit ribosomal protein L13